MLIQELTQYENVGTLGRKSNSINDTIINSFNNNCRCTIYDIAKKKLGKHKRATRRYASDSKASEGSHSPFCLTS